MSLAAALVLAVAGAVLLDVSYLLQQRSASRLPALRPRHPVAAARAVVTARLWLAGAALGVAGWVVSLAAIAYGELSLVQAASASGIAILAVIASAWFGERLGRRERWGVLVTTAGLVALGLTLGGPTGGAPPPAPAAVWAWTLVSVGGALALLRSGGRLASRAALAGVAAGLVLGAGRVATKGLIEGLPPGAGGAALLGAPLLYLTGAAYALGIWVQAVAFQRGEALRAIGLLVAATSVSPIVAGLVVFHDPLPTGPAGLALRIGGFVLVLAGGALLATRVMTGPASPHAATPPVREAEPVLAAVSGR